MPPDRELADSRERRITVRRPGLLALAAVLASACSSSPEAAQTSTTQTSTTQTSTTQTVPYAHGPLAVVVQVGDYHLGVVPDMFVFGPEIVIYGDRTVYAELFDGANNGVATYRLVQGRMSEKQLQRLLRDAEALPPESPVGLPAIDAFPLLLVGGARSWDINDVSAKPFAAYLDELRSTVRSAATDVWQPSRWIVRPYGALRCSAVQQPSEPSFFDAPVYPHVLDHYSPRQFDC